MVATAQTENESGALTEQAAIALSATSSLDLEYTVDGGIKKSSFTNACEIVLHDKYLVGRFRLNLLDGRPYLKGFFWNIRFHAIQDADLFQIRKYIANLYEVDNKENIRQAVAIAAYNNAFHPIRELLDGLKWDGQERIRELLPRYLGAEQSEYTTAVTTMLLHGAIQRVFEPGVKFDYCIILVDTKQGTGKSSLCRFLALNDEWFCDALGDLSDLKRAYEAIRGHWICEIGELVATRRTKDIEVIKAYLSRQADDYRDPYGIYPERRPRQCVFIGTSNKPQCLPDDKTGNRRFITVVCDGNRAVVHPMADEAETRAYIMQCYAEALELGRSGGWILKLDPKFDDVLREIQDAVTPEDTKVGQIQEWLDSTNEDIVCSRMIYHDVFDANGNPQKYELEDISDIMNLKIKGWQKYRGANGSATSQQYRFKEYGRQRAWQRIVNSDVNSSVNSDEFLPVTDENWDEIPF